MTTQGHLDAEETRRIMADSTSAGHDELPPSVTGTLSTPLLRPGDRVKRRVIERQLTGGAMSTVYLAYDQDLETRLVLKFPDTVGDSREYARFREEIRLLAKVNHPNVVRVGGLELFLDQDGKPVSEYFTMEFVEGLPLDALEGRSYWEKLQIFEQLCDGVGAVHREGIVHRDIKPANVVVKEWTYGRRQHQPVLLDFGIGGRLKKNGHGQAEFDQGGRVMGSLAYASPEQLRGEPLTASSDVYALGLALHELLTGEAYRAEDPTGLLRASRHSSREQPFEEPHTPIDPPRVPLRHPDQWYARWLLLRTRDECLQPRSEDRPQDAEQVARKLDRWTNGYKWTTRLAAAALATALSITPVAVGTTVYVKRQQDIRNELEVRNPDRIERANASLHQCAEFVAAADPDTASLECGKAQRAIDEFYVTSSTAHELDALDARIRFYVGTIHLLHGKYGPAQQELAFDRALLPQGSIEWRLHPVRQAQAAQDFERATGDLEALWQDTQDPQIGFTLARGYIDQRRREDAAGQLQEIIGLVERRRERSEPLRLGDHIWMARALLEHAELMRMRGDLDRASEDVQEALSIAQARDNNPYIAIAKTYEGLIANSRGDYARAERVLREAVRLHRTAGSVGPLAKSYQMLGIVLVNQGKLHEGSRHLGESLGMFVEAGNVKEALRSRYNYASSLLAYGRVAEAVQHSFAGEREAQEIDDTARAALQATVGLEASLYGADLALSAERYASAMRLFGEEQHHMKTYAMLLRAHALLEQGQPAAAADTLLLAAQQGKTYDMYNQGYGASLEALLVAQQGGASAGHLRRVQELTDALQGTPLESQLLLTQGTLYAQRAELPRALQAFSAAIEAADKTQHLQLALGARLAAVEALLPHAPKCACPQILPGQLDAMERTFNGERGGIPFYDPLRYDSTQLTDALHRYKTVQKRYKP